jgi:hypothetical protein
VSFAYTSDDKTAIRDSLTVIASPTHQIDETIRMEDMLARKRVELPRDQQ